MSEDLVIKLEFLRYSKHTAYFKERNFEIDRKILNNRTGKSSPLFLNSRPDVLLNY
jgi:hypothetical protein